jgi:hypothetical protein
MPKLRTSLFMDAEQSMDRAHPEIRAVPRSVGELP